MDAWILIPGASIVSMDSGLMEIFRNRDSPFIAALAIGARAENNDPSTPC